MNGIFHGTHGNSLGCLWLATVTVAHSTVVEAITETVFPVPVPSVEIVVAHSSSITTGTEVIVRSAVVAVIPLVSGLIRVVGKAKRLSV
jgi:hypothetical protein